MYTLADYLWMISDGARVAAYADALRAQVQPGARVLEVGAGFGFFSVLAVRAGASHVDAVETNPVVHLGPKVAAANGCADRITFHHRDLRFLTLDQPADLLLLDLRGPTPFGPRSLEVLVNARNRFLRREGAIIAARDTLFVAPSRAPVALRRERDGAGDDQGIDLGPVERILSDTPIRHAVAVEDLVAPGQPWLELDYRTVDATAFSGQAQWSCVSNATVEGLAVWFEADLGAGRSFSTAPGSAVVAYSHLFIPFRRPCEVASGDVLRVELGVRQVRESYVWEWRVRLTPRQGTDELDVADQNSVAELIIDPAAFTITSPDARPTLGARGCALRHLLDRMDGHSTIDALAADLHQSAPGLFQDVTAAAEFVGHWTQAADRLERGGD